MESNKLTVEEFARKNIGKSFKTFDKDYIIPFKTEAMIVGYSSFKQLLICSVTECGGWRRFDEDDILLVHSPLSYSYFYIAHTELIAKNFMITIEQICSLNLGKEIDYYRDYKVMVVGYNKRFNFIICSCTKNDGWTEMIDSDTILIQSPLNVSFFYITPKYEYYRMQLQLP